jgi:hypothetical protein
MKFKRPKKIKFRPFDELIAALQVEPISASTMLPQWYKKLPRYVQNSGESIKALGIKDLKTCVPFRDAMIAGYMLRLPADIEVKIMHDGDVEIFFNPASGFKPVEKRGGLKEGNQGFGMPHPLGTAPVHFAWSAWYGFLTNKEDSVLVTHPFNRHDLPFVTTSGIMDTGYFQLAGNIPFFIKEGFEGIIEKGTPVAQIIPFKREDWSSEIIKSDVLNYQKVMALRDSYLEGFYSRFLRQSRSYK